jgi:hypothetical protein
MIIQEPLKQMNGITVNGPDIRKDGLKPCEWLKFISQIFEKYFRMNNLIDRMAWVIEVFMRAGK